MRSSQFWQITAANYSSLKTRRRGRARRRMKATGNERERKVLAEANGFTLNSVKWLDFSPYVRYKTKTLTEEKSEIR